MIFDGPKFRELREQKLLSRSQMAKKLGIARPQISRWETGKCQPRIDTVKKICAILGVAAEELVTIEEKAEAAI